MSAINVDLLREAARRAKLPPEVTVADIENLAREYEKERLAQALRVGDTETFTKYARLSQRDAPEDETGMMAEAMHGAYERDPNAKRIEWADLNEVERRMWLNHARRVLANLAAIQTLERKRG